MKHDTTHEASGVAVVDDPRQWSALLDIEESRCLDQGFQAGIIAINIRRDDDSVVDARDPLELASRARAVITDSMGWTDRACRVSDHEFGMLVIPLRGYRELRERAIRVNQAMHDAGLDVRVGYAVRNDQTGLAGAAARADAAAANPHQRPS